MLVGKYSQERRTHLNIQISVQDRGGVLFQTADIREYFEKLKSDANKDIGPKDNVEKDSDTPIKKGDGVEARPLF